MKAWHVLPELYELERRFVAIIHLLAPATDQIPESALAEAQIGRQRAEEFLVRIAAAAREAEARPDFSTN